MEEGAASLMSMIDALRQRLKQEGVLDCTIRVRPHAATTHIKSILDDGSIKVDLAAPAEENKANIELVRFLAETFGVSAASVSILSGATSRVKLVRISA